MDDGKIVSISLRSRSDTTGDSDVIDGGELLVLPGMVNPHVHDDDLGYTDREDFA